MNYNNAKLLIYWEKLLQMKDYIEFSEKIPIKEKHQLIVCGAGVAGVAAAVAAARHGVDVLLLEKNLNLGGLATNGLINFFVPACQGRGIKIIKGMSQEFFDLSIKYGFDTVPDKWKEDSDTPKDRGGQRYVTKYSANIFALALAELVTTSKIKLLLDVDILSPIMENGHCKGVVVAGKDGKRFYPADYVIDATGDADIMYRAGVPCMDGKNYFTYCAYKADMNSCKNAVESGDISRLYVRIYGGSIDLYGHNQPSDIPLYKGTSIEDVSEFILKNQQILLDKIKNDDRTSRDIILTPSQPQFRTTRCIKGGHIFSEKDAFVHFDDSIGAICDFDRRDYIFEVPFRCLVNERFDNLLTAGRSASADGYGWDILRVIPPAIITGQAAGTAVSVALNGKCDINRVDIAKLQDLLSHDNVMIHFDDSLIPSDDAQIGEHYESDHI